MWSAVLYPCWASTLVNIVNADIPHVKIFDNTWGTSCLLFIGASSCIGGASTAQGVGGVSWSFGGRGNGDDDPEEHLADYNKRWGGCGSDEGVCSIAEEEQPSDQSAKELVPGTDTSYVKTYKESNSFATTWRDSGVQGPRPMRALPQYLPFQALGELKQQANPNPYEYSGNSYEGEESQWQKAVRDDRSPLPPPLPLPNFPQQVTSPHEVSSLLDQSVYTKEHVKYLCNSINTAPMFSSLA